MTLSTVAVLRPGDWVLYDGSEHQVLALAGTSVRLRTVDGADSVVLAGHLMASPGFAVVDSEPAPSVEPFALLDSLPGAVLDTAREWERHVVEIETGLPPGAEPGVAPKPECDPTRTTVVDRDRAKAAELGVGVRTVQTRRAHYAQQGLWGLVDQRAVRAWEATGRADARLVAAAREVIDAGDGHLDGHQIAADPPRDQSRGGNLRTGGGADACPHHVLPADRRTGHWPAHVRLGGDASADREPAAGHVHPDARRPAG
jgi:hypothetical protein